MNMEKQEILEAIRRAYSYGFTNGLCYAQNMYDDADKVEEKYTEMYERIKEEL